MRSERDTKYGPDQHFNIVFSYGLQFKKSILLSKHHFTKPLLKHKLNKVKPRAPGI